MKSFSTFINESNQQNNNQLDESFKGRKVELTSGKDKVRIGVMDSILVVYINNNMVIVDNPEEYKKAITFFKSI
jgi:hypothetical protein